MVVLEDSIEIFRKNIFSMTDRRQIPYLIYQILERDVFENLMTSDHASILVRISEISGDTTKLPISSAWSKWHNAVPTAAPIIVSPR